jgi:hypothetical protein
MTLIVVALGLLLGLAACGGRAKNNGIASASGAKASSSAAPSPTSSANLQEQLLQYAKCMRAHGIDMPDPQVAGGRVTFGMKAGQNQAKLDAAQRACKQYAPNGGQAPSMSPEMLEQARKYAACMRQHGVNMPDPSSDGGMRVNGVNPNDPTFKAAEQACRSLMPQPSMRAGTP